MDRFDPFPLCLVEEDRLMLRRERWFPSNMMVMAMVMLMLMVVMKYYVAVAAVAAVVVLLLVSFFCSWVFWVFLVNV